MATYCITEWTEHQHYKDRDPTWVKLYQKTLTSVTWLKADALTRAIMVGSLLLAARHKNCITIDEDVLIPMLAPKGTKWEHVLQSIRYLEASGYISIDAILENIEEDIDQKSKTPRRPPKGATYTQEFLDFWQAYPHKVGKDAAWKAWQKRQDRPDLKAILAAVASYATTKPADREWANPATWLNQGRWNDAPAVIASGSNGAETDFGKPPPGVDPVEWYAKKLDERDANGHKTLN